MAKRGQLIGWLRMKGYTQTNLRERAKAGEWMSAIAEKLVPEMQKDGIDTTVKSVSAGLLKLKNYNGSYKKVPSKPSKNWGGKRTTPKASTKAVAGIHPGAILVRKASVNDSELDSALDAMLEAMVRVKNVALAMDQKLKKIQEFVAGAQV